MNCMLFFNTFLGLVALIVSGLIGATLAFLLMNLGKTPHARLRLGKRTSKLGNPQSQKIVDKLEPRPLWKNDHNK